MAIVLAIVAGSWYWLGHKEQDSNVAAGGASVKLDASSTGKGISLDGSAAESADNNPLKVVQAQDLGQTGMSTGANNSSSSEPGTDTPNPSPDTFAAYDKYKTADSAMFADMVKGAGAEAVTGKKVAVNYKGWLTDGQLFDESKNGSAFVFTPGEHRVILGWEEGMVGMKVGGKRLLIVPPAVGYGAEGKSPIPPNAVMVFIVELVEVEK